MKKISVILLIFLQISSLKAQENKNKTMIYKNDEIEIKFSGQYSIADDKKYSKEGYFSTSTEHIKFCKIEPQPAYVQQVYSEDGYLCSMYILPIIEDKKLSSEVEKAFEPKGALASLSDIKKLKIGKFEVLKWRAQNGKTRLDHYILKTNNHYYLFISSPYGSNGSIEKIISDIKLHN